MKSDEPSSTGCGVAAVILAAGLGTRMRSRISKELQPLAGRTLLDYVLNATFSAQPDQIIVVLSPAKADIAQTLPPSVDVAWQEEPLGTGHAAAQAMPILRPEIERVAILFGDHPLLTPEAVSSLLERSSSTGALVTLLTALLDDPGAYGRLRYESGRITRVVESKEDSSVYSSAVEIYSGISCYDRRWLEAELPVLPRSAGGEYYLTSLVERAARVTDISEPVVSMVAEPETAYGVNDRVDLAAAERIMRRRINERLMRSGVAIVDPASTFIDDTVEIGQDARIEPFTTISGDSSIGDLSIIGPQSIIRDSEIGTECEVVASTIEQSRVGDRVHIGPYAHLRPGAAIEDDVHIGNYAEIKNTHIGSGTHVGHVSYLGDAELGEGVNIGAGTIIANYDGQRKHQTMIGDGAFIGSDSVLIAPVVVGDQARTGAGSVVNRDVAPNSLVVGIPARPIRARRATGSSGDSSEK